MGEYGETPSAVEGSSPVPDGRGAGPAPGPAAPPSPATPPAGESLRERVERLRGALLPANRSAHTPQALAQITDEYLAATRALHDPDAAAVTRGEPTPPPHRPRSNSTATSG